MSSSMKRRRRETGVENARTSIGSERGRTRGDVDARRYEYGGLDELSLREQRRATTFSRARGRA